MSCQLDFRYIHSHPQLDVIVLHPRECCIQTSTSVGTGGYRDGVIPIFVVYTRKISLQLNGPTLWYVLAYQEKSIVLNRISFGQTFSTTRLHALKYSVKPMPAINDKFSKGQLKLDS